MRRWFIWLARTVAMIAVIVAITAWLLIAWPMRVTHPALKLANGTLAIVEEHARLGYHTPAHVHTREDETLYWHGSSASRMVVRSPISRPRGDSIGVSRTCPV